MKPATLRLIVHAGRERAAWRAKATSFAGINTLELRIGDDEVVIYIRPDQEQAARTAAAAINAAFGSG